MKLKPEFLTHEMNGEHLTVPVGRGSFSGVVKSNKTAGFIIEQMKNEISEERIVQALLDKYEVSSETAENDVKKVIAILRSINAIQE